MFKRLWIVANLVLATCFATTARAGEEKAGQPLVVLVGIDKFQDNQIKSRKHAEADAKAIYDVFTANEHLGVKADRVKLLLGTVDPKRPSELASRDNIAKAMKWLETEAKAEDLVVFGYFGQGSPVGERVCYFGVDSTFKDRAKNAIASGDMQNLLEKIKSQKFVGLYDVHFLGIDLPKDQMPDANTPNIFKQFVAEDAETQPSRSILMANNGLKPSLDLEKHGIFASVVLEALRGNADKFGYEPDGSVTISEFAKFVKEGVHNKAVEVGKNNDEKGQQAIVIDMHKTDFVIDRNPAAFPKAAQRLEKFPKVAEETGLTKELADEGLGLLRTMPKLKSQQDLRKAYQKLVDGGVDADAFRKERDDIIQLTRISERESQQFANYITSAAQQVRQGYVKDVPQVQLIQEAVKGLYRAVDEKIPQHVADKLESFKPVETVKILVEARQHLGKREDLDKGKDVTFSLHGMLSKLDRHSDYVDPESARRMEVELGSTFSGIGVQIRQNNIRDQLQVVTPIFNSPAYKKKIYAGDIITQIIREVDSDGKPLSTPEIVPTKGLSTEEAVKKITGKEGTKVKLQIDREGEEKPLVIEVVRGRVEGESVMGYKRGTDDTWNYVVDPQNKICYVRLTQFGQNTYRDLEKVMRRLYAAGIKGFVLDLRFNPGGLLDAAVKISDLYIDDGMIVSIRPRKGPETSYVGKSDGSYTTFPMVCLINSQSASASEIVSAALQDHGRAIIIGTRSFGKGSVQTIHRFETGGRLKLTTATFWRPSGRNLNRSSTGGKDEDEWGVSPDAGFDLKLSKKEENDLFDSQRDREVISRPDKRGEESAKSEFRDRQLDAALEYLRGQIRPSLGKNQGSGE